MNILIVGNGFDLSHYLPTKYDHFMIAMDAIENWDIAKGEMGFDDLFIKDYWHKNNETEEEWQNSFFQHTKAMYKTEEIKISVDEIQHFQKQLKENVWYQYFKYYRSKCDTWIDLEQKIDEALNCCNAFFNKVNLVMGEHSKISYFFKRLDENLDTGTVRLHNREIHILFLLSILSNKVLVEKTPKQIWRKVDGENDKDGVYTIINDEFIDENAGYMSYKFNKVIDHLTNNIEKFIELFNFYLVNFIEVMELKVNLNNGLELKPDIIYSFNYTKTYQHIYGGVCVEYLHGRCGKQQNIVLGISDLEDESLKKLKAYGFTKYHQKLFNNTDYRFLGENSKMQNNLKFWTNMKEEPHKNFYNTANAIARQTNIHIWGHSLDISDGNYINEIFSFNERWDCNVKVTVYYFDRSAKFSLLNNLLAILGKEKVEKWMKKDWLKFEPNPDIAKINHIKAVDLPKP